MIGMLNLRELLLKEDHIETEQRLNNGININDMGLEYGPGIIPRIPKGKLFKNSYIAATKQHRYSYMPAHTHSFLEFNYQFSGKSVQQLNGHEYILESGDLLAMDRSLIQRYGYMGHDDLLVNVLLNLEKLPHGFINDIRPAQGLNRFLYNALNRDSRHDNFIIYHLPDTPFARRMWDNLCLYSLQNIRPYETRVHLLKAALSCLPMPVVSNVHVLNYHHDQSVDILDYIEKHFQTTSLSEISNNFNYNKNYLGNKIKIETGMTFDQLISRKRLLTAEGLLLDTKMPITEIARRIGYDNASSLYRLFQNHLGMTPAQFRNNHKNELSIYYWRDNLTTASQRGVCGSISTG